MYARYKKTQMNQSFHYEFIEQISLFGCNNGLIPWLLKQQTPSSQNEPYRWHVDVLKALSKTDDFVGSTLLIDLKPKQNKTNLSLYELIDVWGYSADGWTPILLHIDGLFVDANPEGVDRNSFEIAESKLDEPIYEFLYLAGSIKNGELIGTWNAPPASPTNAALLWPNTLKYFVQCIRECTPHVLAL